VGDSPQGPVRLRTLLDPLAHRLGLAEAGDLGRLWAGWQEIVGATVARHAEPSSLRAGTLRVRTDSPTWATEITYLSEAIRAGVNAWLGKEVVKQVRVWTGPGRVGLRRPTERGNRPLEPSEEARAGGEEDPRVALQRARRAWMSARGRRAFGYRQGPGQSEENAW
jgi:hypothetical protein